MIEKAEFESVVRGILVFLGKAAVSNNKNERIEAGKIIILGFDALVKKIDNEWRDDFELYTDLCTIALGIVVESESFKVRLEGVTIITDGLAEIRDLMYGDE